jgi:hypothetical protein
LFEIKKAKRSRKQEKEKKTNSKWAGPFGLQQREKGARRFVTDAKGVK